MFSELFNMSDWDWQTVNISGLDCLFDLTWFAYMFPVFCFLSGFLYRHFFFHWYGAPWLEMFFCFFSVPCILNCFSISLLLHYDIRANELISCFSDLCSASCWAHGRCACRSSRRWGRGVDHACHCGGGGGDDSHHRCGSRSDLPCRPSAQGSSRSVDAWNNNIGILFFTC